MNEHLAKLLETPIAEAGMRYADDERTEKARAQKLDAEGPLVTRQATEVKPGRIAPPLDTYSAADLYGKKLERPPLVVDGLIPVGLTTLAGSPKLGKSWLALAMGIAVASGTEFLGMRTRQGEVLYLDLESSQYRVQDRLSKLMAGAYPAKLYISHDAQRMEGGLLDQLEEWCSEHPKTSLIVVDTLARVKGGARRNENAYEADSRIYGELQKFAQSHKLAIMVVHHLRKRNAHGGDVDPVERISGSMGLARVCDAILMLDGKRGEDTSTLTATARDFDQQEFVLRFDKGAWSLQATDSEAWREEQAYARSDVVRGVLALMRNRNPPEWKGTAQQLLDAIQAASNHPLEVFQARRLSAELEKMSPQLYERDGISVTRRLLNGRKIIALKDSEIFEI